MGPNPVFSQQRKRKRNKKENKKLMEWEKIVSNDATDKGLISKIYKQLIQQPKKPTTHLKNGQKT